jgi:two-component system OmpR family sensor kinase
MAPWLERARALPGRIPLRIRLVASVVVLAALALFTTGFAASAALQRHLVARVDAQLEMFADQARHGAVQVPRDPPSRDRQLPSAFFVAVKDADGQGPARIDSPLHDDQGVPALPPMTNAEVARRDGRPFTVPSMGHGGHEWRVLATPVPGTTGSVIVGLSLDEVQNTVAQLRAIITVVSVAVLVLMAVLGYLAVRSSLRPLAEVEDTAEAIAAGDLTRRVPEGDPRTEVGRLARSFNAMLRQIESAFRAREASEAGARRSEERMRQFVADASHELRTPLASIRGFAELYRQGAVPEPADVERVMRRIEDESVRMGVLVEDLLLLARVDERRPLEHAPVDLLAIATDAVHDARALAPDRRIDLDLLSSEEPPVVLGDDSRLRQVVANLVNNAFTHTPADTAVRIRVGVDGEWAVLEVADDGPGLAPGQASRVFERFYRADPSRTRSSGGTGLGLSIVAALVAAHGGTAEVTTAPGRGATFRVRLPRPVGTS